jgi:hypothetical protein
MNIVRMIQEIKMKPMLIVVVLNVQNVKIHKGARVIAIVLVLGAIITNMSLGIDSFSISLYDKLFHFSKFIKYGRNTTSNPTIFRSIHVQKTVCTWKSCNYVLYEGISIRLVQCN